MFYRYDTELAKKNFAKYDRGVAVFYGVLCFALIVAFTAVSFFVLGDLPFTLNVVLLLVEWAAAIIICTARVNYLRQCALTAFYKTKQGTVKMITFKQTDFSEANSSTFFSGVFTGLFNFAYFKKERETFDSLQDEEFVKQYVFGNQPNNRTQTIVSVDFMKEGKKSVRIKGTVTNKNGITKFFSKRVPKAYTNYDDLISSFKKLKPVC